jgi:hypothetical protein
MDVNSNNGGSANQNVESNQAIESPQQSVPQQDTPNLGAIRKSGQQEVLNALGKVLGQDFGKTNEAISYIEQLVNNANGGSAKPTQTNSRSNQGGSEMAELRSMIQGLQEQVAQKDQAVRRTSLQSNIKDVAVKTGFDPNMLDIATNLFESQIDFDESGNYFVKGSNGSVKLDAKGNPYTMELLAQDILRSRPKLAADEGRSGTGSKFGMGIGQNNNEIPDASTDLEGWKAWKERNGIGGRNLKGMQVSVNKPLV